MDRIPERVAARYATLPEVSDLPSGKTASLQAGLEEAFRRLEKAVDDHERLSRVPGPKGEPEMHFTRLGGTLSILVTLKGSRKRPTKITGDGGTLDAAVEDLIHGLDMWAEAIS